MSQATTSSIGHLTLADSATTSLFNAILDGTLPGGTHLRLKDLAERFGVSMMPMREAVRRLEHLGLVEIEAHRGAFVRSQSLEDLHSTYEARVLLEVEAAGRAAGKVTAAQQQVAREALDDLTHYLGIGDTEHARVAHERFHFTIYEAAGNPWLVRSIIPLWRNAERYRLLSMRDPDLAIRRAREHDAILEAVVAGDVDTAQSSMRGHLCYSMELAVEAFAESDTASDFAASEPSVGDRSSHIGASRGSAEMRSW